MNVSIKAASIDTSTADRDAHLRSDDFFAVEKYPALTFTSTRVTKKTERVYDVTGTLTIRGVAKEVTLPVTFLGAAKDPWGNERVGFETEIDDQPEGLRPDVERGARNRRLPRRRRGEDQRFGPGDRASVTSRSHSSGRRAAGSAVHRRRRR